MSSPMPVVARRAFGRISGQATTVLAAAASLAAAGALFANGIFEAEGKAVSVASVWAISMANVLPLLVSLLTMRLWSDGGNPERVEIDLVTPAPERTFAGGKFIAAYVAVEVVLALALAMPVLVLPRCAPALASGARLSRLLPAFAGLSVLAMPLVAVGSLSSALFRRAAPAAVVTFMLTWALPVAAYRALVTWSPLVRMRFAEAPLDSVIAAAADGRFSVSAIALAVSVAFLAIFTASKTFAMRRLAGGGKFVLKVSSVCAIASATLATALFCELVRQFECQLEWPGASSDIVFSARTREILSSVSREVHVTVCVRRNSPEFIPVARLLNAIAAESRSAGGVGVKCDYIDPRWDPNGAAMVVRNNGGEGFAVFSAGRRSFKVPVKDLDEKLCASTIQRLSMPSKSESVLFTAGHGEPSVKDFGPGGMSDAARALMQEGYRVDTLAANSRIPSDCSVLAIVGASDPFSAGEIREVEMFLSQGGHILATVSSSRRDGIWSLLETFGVALDAGDSKVRTTDGSDIVASAFGEHAVTAPLEGSVVVFAPDSVKFKTGAPAAGKDDGFTISPLCESLGSTFAIAAEKGASLKSDLAIRPVRLVVIGDPSFLRNSSISMRANANRDFFLNSVAWLAGVDASGSTGMAGDVMSLRMDRRRRIRFALVSACGVPGAVALAGLLILYWRRRRT